MEVIDDWLRDDLDAPRKQRHTAKRIFDRLLDEHDAVGVVSYWMVREYVATRRREIRIEAGREPANAFIPQEHLPGREAEVDFGEVAIRLRGELVTCALFSLRLSYSGKAVHRISASSGQEAFFEGHAYAFDVLGGVPTGKIRYDNLKAAVANVIGFSRQRVEADRWTAFRSHYGIEAFYCQPGIQGAHEKGGVEGQIGWFRRNHLVPVPEVESFAELNAMVDAWDQADDARRMGSRARTVGEHFATEQPLLAPLPAEPFETGRWFNPPRRPVRPGHRPYEHVLRPGPCDQCADEILDVEHRTAMRRFLSRAAAGDPAAFRRKASPTRGAAAVAWVICRANDTVGTSWSALSVQELLGRFGVKGSVAQRAEPLLRANGVDPHRLYGTMELGRPCQRWF